MTQDADTKIGSCEVDGNQHIVMKKHSIVHTAYGIQCDDVDAKAVFLPFASRFSHDLQFMRQGKYQIMQQR